MQKKDYTWLWKNLTFVSIGILISWIITLVGAQNIYISGSSMEPNFQDGQLCKIDKWTYRKEEPERFDVIAFPQSEGTIYVKRIIGLPGETVQIKEDGCIYINGTLLEEQYGKEKIWVEKIGIASKGILLSEDEYFVLGDNRNNSMDSRCFEVGNVKKDKILGKVKER